MSTHNDAVADALIAEVAQLRAERDNAIAECVMHIGNAKALRDRLNWFEEAGGVAMATRIYQVIGERDALAALLNEAQGFIVPDTAWDYTTDAGGYLYDRIEAALKGKP